MLAFHSNQCGLHQSPRSTRLGWRGLVAVAVMLAVAVSTAAPAPGIVRRKASSSDSIQASVCRPGHKRAIQIVGWLRPCGTALIDRQRRRARLLSLNMSGMIRGAGNRMPPKCGHWAPRDPQTFRKAKQQGFNSVSLMVTWANLEPRRPVRRSGRVVHRWSRTYLRAVDDAIRQAKKRGLEVVLVMIQSRWSPAFQDLVLPNGEKQDCGIGMPPWMYPRGGGLAAMVRAQLAFFRNRNGQQRGLITAWKKLARRYRHNRTVIGAVLLSEAYDLLAQPYPGTGSLRPGDLKLASFYERLGRAVHAVNPHLLLIYWDYLSRRTGRFAVTRRPAVPRRVYAFEFYGGTWRDGLPRLRRFERRGHRWNHPVSIAEFTAFNYTRRHEGIPFSPNWRQDSSALLRWAKRHRLGWSIAGEVDARLARLLRQWR